MAILRAEQPAVHTRPGSVRLVRSIRALAFGRGNSFGAAAVMIPSVPSAPMKSRLES